MKQSLKKRLTAGFLTVCLLVSQGVIPISAYAEGTETGDLCEHHPVHTVECGYAEGTPCNHEHTDDCYRLVEKCVHKHTADCYPEDNTDGVATPSDAEPTECGHVCSEETGCIRKVLNCQHVHDSECGFTVGHACGYVCEICGASTDKGSGKPEESKETCSCTERCSAEQINTDCPICKEDYSNCTVTQKPDIAGGIITEFSRLDKDILNQEVDSGTALEDLNLPDELEVSVYSEDETGESDMITVTTVAVTDWESDPAYDGETGTYVFTPELTDEYPVEEGVKAPKITVTVIPAQANGLMVNITDWEWIDPNNFLSEGVLSLTGASLDHQADFDTVVSMLPTQISAKIEGAEPETLNIAGWTCPTYAQDVDDNWPTSGSHTFTADLPEGYALSDDAAVLAVTVNVPDAPVMMLAATDISYLDKDGKKQNCAKAAEVGSGSVSLNNGWYVLNRNETIYYLSTVKGDVHLILADGCTLTANVGINVSNGNSLTIYAQSTGENMGKLIATGGDNQAGIGGGNGAGGTITINGGEIIATGGKCGAGIGGAYDGDGGNITIRNGIVEATGGLTSAGIGGGGCGDTAGGGAGGNIRIEGGTVKATGGSESSSYGYGSGGTGIGGGQNASGGTITISGGTVEATGISRAAGIGGGRNGNGGTITISGGKVTAKSNGSYGAGIGGGQNGYGSVNYGSGGNITISGGEVTATGGDYAAGIGGGNKGQRGRIIITGGKVIANAGPGGLGAGIGDGSNNSGGNDGQIIITGGTVAATGSSRGGAGIGGGTNSDAGRIEIRGGTVKAMGKYGGAGIGGSKLFVGGDIVVSGGTVTAIGGDDAVGIGNGNSNHNLSYTTFSTGDNGSAVIITTLIIGPGISESWYSDTWGGVIIQNNSGKVYGNQEKSQTTVAPIEKFTIPTGKTVTVPSGMTLDVNVTMTIEAGSELIVDGTLDLSGGTLINNGTISGSGKITPDNKKLTANITNISVAPTTFTGSPAQVTYTYTGNSTPTVTWYADNSGTKGSSIPAPSAVGTYHVGVSAPASGIYQAVAEKTQSFTIKGIAQDTPNAGIDYEVEVLTGLVDGASYSITLPDSASVTKTAVGGTISIESGWMGKNISIIKKAVDSNHADSAAQSLSIPTRPKTPSLAYNGNSESVTIPSGYCYNTASMDYADSNWIEGSGANVSVSPGATIYIYKTAVKGDSPAFKSAVQTLTVGQRGMAPTITIDYVAETLDTTAEMEYSVDGATGWSACGEDMAIPSDWTSAGKTVYIRTKATGSTVASSNADIIIPARPEAPAGDEAYSIDTSTEKITINGGYEVSISSDFSKGTVSDGSTVAPDTTLYARKKAVTGTSFKSAVQTITVPNRGVIPAVAIDYENETLSTTTDIQYKVGGSVWADCEANMAVTVFGWDGMAKKSVQFRTKATAGSYASEAQTVSIPARPNAPTGSEAYCIDTGMEKITVNTGYEVNTSADFSGDSVNDGSNVTPGTTLYARKKAVTGTSFKSAVQTITAPSRGVTPSVTIDYRTETISTTVDMQYSTDGGTIWTNCTAGMNVSAFGWDGVAEKNVQFRTKATADDYASVAQNLSIPVRPAAPSNIQGENETIAGKKDGRITGVSSLMAYSANDGTSWTDCPGTTITGLTPGNYLVRLKAVTSNGMESFAGHSANVTIAIGAEPTYTLNVTAPTFADVTYGYKQPGVQTLTITSSGNSSTTITNVTVSPETAFTIGGSGDTVTAGGDLQTWTIQPKFGLNKGNYMAIIAVSYNGGAVATANVSFTVNGAPQAAPAAPELEQKTTSSVTIKEIASNANGAAAQYSRDGGATWQDSREFTSLSSGTAYSFTARYAETGNYEASLASEPLNVTTSTSSSGGSSSGGGSSDSGGSNSDVAVTTPPVTPEQPNPPTNGESEVDGAVDKDGNATVKVPDQSVTDAINAAKKQAGQNGISVTININLKQTANSLTVTISKTELERLIAENVKELKITSSLISMSFNLEALKEIQKSVAGDLVITANKLDVKALSTAAQIVIGSRPVFALSMQSGGKAITGFGKGVSSVWIPYTLAANEAAGNVQAVYVDEKGAVNTIISSSYDQYSKTVMFGTTHFSIFGVGYKQDAPKLHDITTHWAKNDIEFVVARGLLSGTGNNQFSPNTAMTRGMFVTALGRLAGIDTNSYKTSKFTDVPENAYYASYANWAVSVGITSGTTDTTFSPDESVTRQEMAVFMSNYAKAMGYTIPKAHTAVTFADNSSIASLAADAVRQMQMAGIISGKDGNRFDPTGTATRAEACAVLHRYVELVIDPATASGWVKNDSGHWLYYKGGKALTGWQTIGKLRYYFNADGVMHEGWKQDTGTNKWYYWTNAGAATGWREIDGKWYYFDENGVMAVNTKIDGYEIGPDGARKEK